jgi:hypothetical protein
VPNLRKPANPAPAELLTFDREYWLRDGDGVFDPLHRWKDARARYLEKHPDSTALGNAAERFRTEFAAQFSPQHYPPDATERDDSARAKPGKA